MNSTCSPFSFGDVFVDKRNADRLNKTSNRMKEYKLSVCELKYDKDTNWVCQFGPTKDRFNPGAMIVSNSTDGMRFTSAQL